MSLQLRAVPWIIFALALGIRALYMLGIDDSPLFAHPPVDGLTYVQQADRLAGGNWLGAGEPPFWQPPLYPYLLGVQRLLFGDQLFHALRYLQIVVGSLTCALIWLVARRTISNPLASAIAAIAGAVYGPLIFFDGEVLPATLATFLDLAGLLLLLQALQRPAAARFAAAGAVFGLAALAVATALPFIVAAAVFVWWDTRREHADARRIRWLLAYLLAAGLAILPVTVRNAVIGGEAALISTNAGVNFWVGNNADYDGAVGILPGWEWKDLLERPRVEAGLQRHVDHSGFFFEQSWEYIRSHPLDYIALLARKTYLLWHGEETGRNQGIYYWRNYSDVLAATLWKQVIAFPFGLVAPLALIGLFLAWRRDGVTLPMVFVGVYALSVIAFFITARYRIPLVPVLLVYAAYAGHRLVLAVRQGRFRSTAATLALLVICNLGVTRTNMAGDPLIHFNVATAHSRNGDFENAGASFERAVERDSTYWEAWFNLGTVVAMQQDVERSVAVLERVVRARPDKVIAWINLARSRRLLGDREGALVAYERGLDVDPRAFQYYSRYSELIEFYLEEGQAQEASRVLSVAARYHPHVAPRLRARYGLSR